MNLKKVLLCCAVCCAPGLSVDFVWAEPQVQAGERLSTYLRRNQLVPGLVEQQALYLPGLMFNRTSLLDSQQLLKTQLLTRLQMRLAPGESPNANKMVALIEGLPVTGRLVLQSNDADYLATRPNLDPIGLPADTVSVPVQPDRVVVVFEDGVCELPFELGAPAVAYAKSCVGDVPWYKFNASIDKIWMVQPTGHIEHLNVGVWNAKKNVNPMPGAWLVAPRRKASLESQDWQELAQFLATQGVARLPAEKESLPLQVQANPEVFAQVAAQAPLRDPQVSANDFGLVGLLQTPTARMRKAGSVTLATTRVSPYSRYGVVLQPFDWLEGGFRYNVISNRTFAANKKYLDKNIDLKFRLASESAYMPALALGLNDIGGTGLFSGEYLVASKRVGNFDTSLGLGWGYVGSRGDMSNPLGFVSDKLDVRPNNNSNLGGQFSSSNYFRGPVALFGGVQWHLPWEKWTAKLEFDGNNYQNEPLLNPQTQDSKFNYGLVYKYSDNLDVSISMQRGNTVGLALSVHENLSTFNTPKVSDPKRVPTNLGPRPAQTDWKQTLQAVKAQTDWEVNSVAQRGSEVRLTVRNGDAAYYSESLDRAAAVLDRDLPENIKWFSFDYQQNGMNVAEHVVDRKQWVARQTDYSLASAPRQTTAQASARVPDQAPSDEKPAETRPDVAAVAGYQFPYQPVHEQKPERFSSRFSLGYRQVFGGTDGYLYQLRLANNTRFDFTSSTWANASLAYRLIDNYDKFNQVGSSNLPAVRTQLREYAVTSDFTIPNLQLSHVGKLGANHFYSLYGGLLEDMFAGVGAEYLYRPFNSRYAIGVDVNKVRQRAFEQNFDLLPYTVNTGHLTAYLDTGFENILATVSVGQYLAGDKGVTVDLSREFNNGVRMGAFATRTNVSAADFGEGSFDKGIYVNIPFNAFFTKSIPGEASFLWRPLTRDGGAKLYRSLSLYQETNLRNPKTLQYRPGSGN